MRRRGGKIDGRAGSEYDRGGRCGASAIAAARQGKARRRKDGQFKIKRSKFKIENKEEGLWREALGLRENGAHRDGFWVEKRRGCCNYMVFRELESFFTILHPFFTLFFRFKWLILSALEKMGGGKRQINSKLKVQNSKWQTEKPDFNLEWTRMDTNARGVGSEKFQNVGSGSTCVFGGEVVFVVSRIPNFITIPTARYKSSRLTKKGLDPGAFAPLNSTCRRGGGLVCKGLLIMVAMKAEDFDGKRLMIFDNDDEGRLWKLSAHPSADGKSFAVKRRQTGIDTAQIGKESRFQFVQQIVDEATLAQFEKPKSPYLKSVCDLVWFSNSPQMRHRHRE